MYSPLISTNIEKWNSYRAVESRNWKFILANECMQIFMQSNGCMLYCVWIIIAKFSVVGRWKGFLMFLWTIVVMKSCKNIAAFRWNLWSIDNFWLQRNRNNFLNDAINFNSGLSNLSISFDIEIKVLKKFTHIQKILKR